MSMNLESGQGVPGCGDHAAMVPDMPSHSTSDDSGTGDRPVYSAAGQVDCAEADELGGDTGLAASATLSEETKFHITSWLTTTDWKLRAACHLKVWTRQARSGKSHSSCHCWMNFHDWSSLLQVYCAIFASSLMTQDSQPLGVLVKTPFTKFTKAQGKDSALTAYVENLYHQDACVLCQVFPGHVSKDIPESMQNWAPKDSDCLRQTSTYSPR